ncbi:MAG TPA: NAD(P)H-hydrate dehydratase [Verrucomicrobiae bacterium]|nr:NAD(P)H-hydrate dehydratase [Verrucomicrobiae bacterium]
MPVPVITVAQMREWEKATWASGQTEDAVMQCAGQAVARFAQTLTCAGDSILVLAGKGHNGEDAKYAAKFLSGREAKILEVFDPEAAIKEFKAALKTPPALIIDGLFGIGLNRPLSANWIALIQEINKSGVPILAVDVPSGLNADTGLPLNDAIRATVTVTVGAVKEGLMKVHALPFVGRLEAAPDIGLIPYPFETEVSFQVASDFANYPPSRSVSGHKGTYGHLAIIAGSMGYHGAAVLAARGAQRAQPGLITLATQRAVYEPAAAQLQAVMVRAWDSEPALPENCTSVLVGPGLAAQDIPDALRGYVRKLWQESPLAVVVDASALDWLPPGGASASGIRVITPHPGEAARMLQTTTTNVQADRPNTVRELSHRFGNCYVVLKGHQTLIGRTREPLFVNSSGNPLLAQGGSGDLLGGFIAGLLAQPDVQKEPAMGIRYAVWAHGAAADRLTLTRRNWTVEDLAGVLGS